MKNEVSLLGVVLAGLLVATGTLWAFQRGGNDFGVFYHAWQLVLEGRGAEIYHVSPDRFLYAPGFAWLLAPIALLPKGVALALWCLAKAAVIGFIIREFPSKLTRESLPALGLGAWGVVLLARPLLIDFEYGQVNSFILGACVWALLGHFDRSRPGFLDGLKWFALSVAAVAKIFPLPLLIVPWLSLLPWARFKGDDSPIMRRRYRIERMGSVLGFAAVFLVPFFSEGGAGGWQLLQGWRMALIARGLPLESHNQSFTAFLYHFFSGRPTPVIAEGGAQLFFGFSSLSADAIAWTSAVWVVLSCGLLLYWISRIREKGPLPWIAGAIGLLIIPSHLVWKPYFVMGIPAAILLLHRLGSSRLGLLGIFALFALINLTGFDFIGHRMGAAFEAASTLLWAHLLILVFALGRMPAFFWKVMAGKSRDLARRSPRP